MSTQKVMRQHGRTFFFATRFLPRREPEDISILYAFCRFLDDLVDLKGESCTPIKRQLEEGKSPYREVQLFLEMAKRKNMSLEPVKILLETLEKDLKGTRIHSKSELLRYCYGVAATVGLMMCDIFGVHNRTAHPFAIDLGIGMQLTNIARDIFEDAANDKIYLPQEAFKRTISPDEILNGRRDHEVLAVQKEILTLADLYYASADNGIHFLPRPAQKTILIASRLYQAKGDTIRKNPAHYLKHRADVPTLKKIYYTTKALSSFYLSRQKRAEHDSRLHESL